MTSPLSRNLFIAGKCDRELYVTETYNFIHFFICPFICSFNKYMLATGINTSNEKINKRWALPLSRSCFSVVYVHPTPYGKCCGNGFKK